MTKNEQQGLVGYLLVVRTNVFTMTEMGGFLIMAFGPRSRYFATVQMS